MPAFQRVLLLYNPLAGSGRQVSMRALRSAAGILKAAGVTVELEATHGPGEAGPQARAAVGRGFDAIFACGGDGTVYDVLQGMVHAPEGVSLGILPLGTANVLATDIGIPRNVEAAARALLTFVPRRIAVGQIRWCEPRRDSAQPNASSREHTRYFSVAAGAGVHAELIYRSTAQLKQRGGFIAYYFSGFSLLLRHRFVPFPVEIVTPDGNLRREEVVEVVAMRVSSFGKWLDRWRPGGALERDYLQLITLKPSSRWALLRYTLSALFRGTTESQSRSANIEFISANRVRCLPPLDSSLGRILAQADGEVLTHTMPLEISIVPRALSLLMPPSP